MTLDIGNWTLDIGHWTHCTCTAHAMEENDTQSPVLSKLYVQEILSKLG